MGWNGLLSTVPCCITEWPSGILLIIIDWRQNVIKYNCILTCIIIKEMSEAQMLQTMTADSDTSQIAVLY